MLGSMGSRMMGWGFGAAMAIASRCTTSIETSTTKIAVHFT
jgi:hypothetical protein